MPRPNTPSHNPLKQQAGERGIAVNASLTRRVTKLQPKTHRLSASVRVIHATFAGWSITLNTTK
jgi:hypothetical protein